MNFNFKLINGKIFEFKEYVGYSEFIDNLEPEPDEIINVLEPFIEKDFEIAHIEYKKYVLFKKSINEIKNLEKLWSNIELRRLSEYNLDYKVLDWLSIRETIEDKEIKETLKFCNFKKEIPDLKVDHMMLKMNKLEKEYYLMNDNIILWYIPNDPLYDKFICSIRNNNLRVAQWLYQLSKSGLKCEFPLIQEIDIENNDNDSFYNAIIKGNLEMVKWIWSLGKTPNTFQIYEDGSNYFKQSCSRGHIDVSKWLYEIYKKFDGISVDVLNDSFRYACGGGHLELAQWILTLGNIDIHYQNENPFMWACGGGYLETAQWLYEYSKNYELVDIYWVDGFRFNSFEIACHYGYLEVAQWLYELHLENIKLMKPIGNLIPGKDKILDLILREEKYGNKRSKYIELVEWLLETFDLNYDNKDYFELIEQRFIMSCKKGELENSKKYYDLYNVFSNKCVEKRYIDINSDGEFLFRTCCKNGYLELLKWLFEICKSDYRLEIDIHIFYEEPFRSACEYGHLETAQWLYSISDYSIDIFIKKEYSFRMACLNGHLDVAKWLWSLGGFHKEYIVSDKNYVFLDNSEIIEWLESL